MAGNGSDKTHTLSSRTKEQALERLKSTVLHLVPETSSTRANERLDLILGHIAPDEQPNFEDQQAQASAPIVNYANRPQKIKDRTTPRVRFFKSKQYITHGIEVKAYPFHEIKTYFNTVDKERNNGQQPGLTPEELAMINVARRQISEDSRIPQAIMNNESLWNGALDSSCKASVLELFNAHIEGSTETLISKLQTVEGFDQLRHSQKRFERTWKDRSGSQDTYFAEQGWPTHSSQFISMDNVAAELIKKEGYYELTFSGVSGRHAIGLVIDEEKAYLMDISRGLIVMAKQDFPLWFNKQCQPANIENRKLSYLRTHYRDNVLVTMYDSPGTKLQAKL